MQYTFIQTLDLSAIGIDTLEVYTLLPGDENTNNDTIISNIENFPAVGPVTNLIPADSSFNMIDPVTFSWSTAADADNYDLYIWRTNNPKPATPTVADITQNNYTYSDYLSKNYLYFWQVIAKNPCSESESDIQVFSFNVFPI